MRGTRITGLLVLMMVVGSGMTVLSSMACHSSGSTTDPADDSHHTEAVQTIEASITSDPQYNTLPATINTCVCIQNLVDSPRTVDGRIDLWLGGGSPYDEWRFQVIELEPMDTWDRCWNNQLLDLESLEQKNIARLWVVDVTPPPYNQPPYPPSGSTAEDTCFFWGVSP